MPSVPLDLTPPDHTAEHRVLIVTGAHLRAEAADRPLAYRLRHQMLEWWAKQAAGAADDAAFEKPSVIVCSDVWYLNNDDLRVLPTVSIGGPGVNALSAFLTERLPGVFTVANVLTVQMDIELIDPVVNIWGMDHQTTVAALDAFVERYLDHFMRRACAAA
ncbi:MAG: hypothetical protein ACKVZJ_05695 [Phycisphaerales bacterium]